MEGDLSRTDIRLTESGSIPRSVNIARTDGKEVLAHGDVIAARGAVTRTHHPNWDDMLRVAGSLKIGTVAP